ncbi:hypothetical protein LZ012_12195 [Dechloromonas sp. XY25]|uniref:Polysaccharide lyase 14 domain-containing protein n=1 Tax=Dechloromonas hankyongensis TaxID=2908002 RepID=A0ABS9K3N4_9RHOO|nr:hypothetical protein [Dechloromonas hankyongensis]MCG2577755.1 hypothetical protein [Dechloromonas hankyongensis]
MSNSASAISGLGCEFLHKPMTFAARIGHLIGGLLICLAAELSVAAGGGASNEPADRLRLYEGEGGATCSHFLADILPWQRSLGDWLDANGKMYGDEAFDVASVTAIGAVWEVTNLVRKWAAKNQARGAFFLRAVGGTGYAVFNSRENRTPTNWPILVLEYADGTRENRKPIADTHLNCSTYRAIGRIDPLVISGQENALLEFELPQYLEGRKLARARLLMTNAKGQPSTLRIGVFNTVLPAFPANAPRQGIAAAFENDRGIEKHPDVVFASGFDEGLMWKSKWANASGEIDIVRDSPSLRFVPLSGPALRINLKKGSNYGSDVRFKTNVLGKEPDDLYFRYYLRFADDWNPTLDGGKMPGMAGTYNTAGWGGRRSDGTNGWSMRGGFLRIFEGDHPMRGLTQLGTYAYHAGMGSQYGEYWPWPSALLAKNRWYCIEQRVKLNSPNASDGVLQIWLDGRLIMERANLRYRSIDRLHIEDVWINIYHGGIDPSPHDQHLFVDNVVVARKYIGPMILGPESNSSLEKH